MLETDKYSVINIRRYLDGNPELGEDDLNQILSEFSCPANPDVEHFFKGKCNRLYKKEPVRYISYSLQSR